MGIDQKGKSLESVRAQSWFETLNRSKNSEDNQKKILQAHFHCGRTNYGEKKNICFSNTLFFAAICNSTVVHVVRNRMTKLIDIPSVKLIPGMELQKY